MTVVSQWSSGGDSGTTPPTYDITPPGSAAEGDTLVLFVLTKGATGAGADSNFPTAWRNGGNKSHDDDNGYEVRTYINLSGTTNDVRLYILTQQYDGDASWTFTNGGSADYLLWACALLPNHTETRDLDTGIPKTLGTALDAGPHAVTSDEYFMSDGPSPETNTVAAHAVVWIATANGSSQAGAVDWTSPLTEGGDALTLYYGGNNTASSRPFGMALNLEDMLESDPAFDPTADPVPSRAASLSFDSDLNWWAEWGLFNVADPGAAEPAPNVPSYVPRGRKVFVQELPFSVGSYQPKRRR